MLLKVDISTSCINNKTIEYNLYLHQFLPVCLQTQPEEGLDLSQLVDEGASCLQVICCDLLNPPQRLAAIPWTGTFPNRNGKVCCHQLQRRVEKEDTHTSLRRVHRGGQERHILIIREHWIHILIKDLCETLPNSSNNFSDVTGEMIGGNIYPPQAGHSFWNTKEQHKDLKFVLQWMPPDLLYTAATMANACLSGIAQRMGVGY